MLCKHQFHRRAHTCVHTHTLHTMPQAQKGPQANGDLISLLHPPLPPPHSQESRMAQHTIQALQSELDSLRADNIKLFEKIKFLQSYPGRVSPCSHPLPLRMLPLAPERLQVGSGAVEHLKQAWRGLGGSPLGGQHPGGPQRIFTHTPFPPVRCLLCAWDRALERSPTEVHSEPARGWQATTPVKQGCSIEAPPAPATPLQFWNGLLAHLCAKHVKQALGGWSLRQGLMYLRLASNLLHSKG